MLLKYVNVYAMKMVLSYSIYNFKAEFFAKSLKVVSVVIK